MEDKPRTWEEVIASNEHFRRLANWSGMPIVTFNTHKLMTFLPGEGSEEGYKAVLDYVDDGRREHHFLTLSGQPGRGKTHLALGIGWFWLENEIGIVKYWQVGELLDEMRREYDKPPKTKYDDPLPGAFEMAKWVDLLILDDLGVEKQTDWAVEQLDVLINYRYINQKPTILTTNLSGDQLSKRISGRLKEGVVVILKGEDYRERIARKRRE